jgi:hypothetical protein
MLVLEKKRIFLQQVCLYQQGDVESARKRLENSVFIVVPNVYQKNNSLIVGCLWITSLSLQ